MKVPMSIEMRFGGLYMERKAKVKFWLDNSDNLLHVQNLATSEIKLIKDQMQIALFLNEHRLTVNDLRG